MNKKKILKSRSCCRVHYNDYRDFKKVGSVFNKTRMREFRKIIKKAATVIIKAVNMLAEQIERQNDSLVASKECDTGRLVNVANKDLKSEVYDHAIDVSDYFIEGLKNIDKPVFENECYVVIESEEK